MGVRRRGGGRGLDGFRGGVGWVRGRSFLVLRLGWVFFPWECYDRTIRFGWEGRWADYGSFFPCTVIWRVVDGRSFLDHGGWEVHGCSFLRGVMGMARKRAGVGWWVVLSCCDSLVTIGCSFLVCFRFFPSGCDMAWLGRSERSRMKGLVFPYVIFRQRTGVLSLMA
jgi:hypothetical protein